MLYTFLDYFLMAFHLILVFFNLFGWILKKTRKLNLISLSITGFFWFVIGAWYGWGYCPCTDWHWQVKNRLGEINLPHSYIKYVLDKITGLDFDAMTVDVFTVAFFIIAFIASIYTNIKYRK